MGGNLSIILGVSFGSEVHPRKTQLAVVRTDRRMPSVEDPWGKRRRGIPWQVPSRKPVVS